MQCRALKALVQGFARIHAEQAGFHKGDTNLNLQTLRLNPRKTNGVILTIKLSQSRSRIFQPHPAGPSVSNRYLIHARAIIDHLNEQITGKHTPSDADGATGFARRHPILDRIFHQGLQQQTGHQAGGGVVADSDAEAEYQESCNKARALIRAAEEAVKFAARDTS